jgi:3-oxoadipate enol-lactonase
MAFMTVDGARLFYRFDGRSDGPVLVLSNSLGTDLSMWEPQIEALAQHFRILRYDSRGHGNSDVSPGPYDIALLGRDVLALLDGLGLERVHFCGLSKGGMVGMWLGTNAPERVERLILCNTSAQIGAPEIWNQRIETVSRHGMAAIVPAVLERWFTPAFRRASPDIVEQARRMLVATPAAGYAACCAAVRDMDQRETIGSIRAATLVTAGAQDAATPPDHARLIAERIAGAQLVELDAAHLSNLEQPADFTAAVLNFLGGER